MNAQSSAPYTLPYFNPCTKSVKWSYETSIREMSDERLGLSNIISIGITPS
eukprot:c53031_g1_i1 orf=2-151(-)